MQVHTTLGKLFADDSEFLLGNKVTAETEGGHAQCETCGLYCMGKADGHRGARREVLAQLLDLLLLELGRRPLGAFGAVGGLVKVEGVVKAHFCLAYQDKTVVERRQKGAPRNDCLRLRLITVPM